MIGELSDDGCVGSEELQKANFRVKMSDSIEAKRCAHFESI